MADRAVTGEKWERTRAKGRRRFVWVHGVVGWGLLTAALFSAVMVGFRGSPAALIPVAFVLFPLGGYVWGAVVWRIAERQYAKERGLTGQAPAPEQPDRSRPE